VEGRKDFLKFMPDGNIGKFASELPQSLKKRWTETMKILTNKQFLWLLENYPKSKVFIKAIEQEDQVETEILFRTSDGRSLRPTEYLQDFEQYVKLNPDHIEALEILLNRPSEFDTKALKELRDKLAQTPYRFTESNLRKAYQFALADIISFIKHAVKGDTLITSEERIEKAIQVATKGQSLTPEQEEWMELIRYHLIENIVIEKGDFILIPFSRRGGWRKAEKVFGEQLSGLLVTINEAMLQ